MHFIPDEYIRFGIFARGLPVKILETELLRMKRKKGKQSNQKKTKAVSCATAKKNIFGNFNLT